MTLKNFLPLSREVKKHWIYKDSSFLHVWIEMLFNARYSDEPKTDVYKGVLYTINRGELLYSISTYSDRLNISEAKLKTLMRNLRNDGMIKPVKSLGRNKPTILQICNFNLYNSTNTEQVEPVDVDGDSETLDKRWENTDDLLEKRSQPLKKKVNTGDTEKTNNNISEIYDFYLDLNLMKHRSFTKAMKDSINKAMYCNKYTIEDCRELLRRHEKVVKITKSDKFPVSTRGLDVFFGQKVSNATHLICSEYADGGKYFEKYKKELVPKADMKDMKIIYIPNRRTVKEG